MAREACVWSAALDPSVPIGDLVFRDRRSLDGGACGHETRELSEVLWSNASTCNADVSSRAQSLRVTLADARYECEPDATKRVTVEIDRQPARTMVLSCPRKKTLPPPSKDLEPIRIVPGTHSLRVRDETTGHEAVRCMCLPALRLNDPSNGESGVLVGAHVSVWVDDEKVQLDDAEALASSGF
jgi:hypothetical protein